jgi:phosphoribosylformimino-5-aminoimidazole carboxamide ribotide isomerase
MTMILFPAIDLKDGRCVRLYKGDMDKATVFNDDPADQARQFEAAGAQWLHLVDLNGAFAGQPVNGGAVESILAAVSMPVQLGGGIRDMATIDMWLGKGVRRVILGTVAVKDPALVKDAARAHAGRIVVGIDARAGMVAVDGWADTTQMRAIDLAKAFEDAGVAALVYTDIDRDGALTGVNVAATAALADSVSIPVIASGGVAGMADLEGLIAAQGKISGTIEGVISGRAIYDGRLDLRDGLKRLAEAARC